MPSIRLATRPAALSVILSHITAGPAAGPVVYECQEEMAPGERTGVDNVAPTSQRAVKSRWTARSLVMLLEGVFGGVYVATRSVAITAIAATVSVVVMALALGATDGRR